MKILLITFLGIVLALSTQAQTDADFFKFRKDADECFVKRDYPCAEKWYKAALVIKGNDKYCKRQLGVIEKKKKAEVAERKRQAQIAEQQRLKDEEDKRKAQLTEQQRLKDEEDKRKLAEQQRLKEEDDKRIAQLAEQQQQRLKEEEDKRKAQLAEQQRLKDEDDKRKAQIAEQQKIKEAEVERLRQTQIAEQQKIKEAEVERQRQIAEQQKIKEEEAKQKAQLAEQQRLKDEEDKRRLAEQRRLGLTNNVLKIVTGAVGIGAGVYAQTINSQWKTKLNTLSSIANIADVGNTGFIVDKASYDAYKKAYDEAKAFQSKTTLRNVCLGIAAGSILAEAYLFLMPKKYSNVVVLKPTTDHYGLGLSVKF